MKQQSYMYIMEKDITWANIDIQMLYTDKISEKKR